jgi:anti-anti-sigma factor
MKITITKTEMPVPVTILHLDGTLDGANYQSLIDKAAEVYAAGARNLVLELSKLGFISSAGLGALHQVALLFQEKEQPGQDECWAAYRWAAYRSVDRDHRLRVQEHMKLVSPTEEVREMLDMIGFSSLFEIYPDLHQASASFSLAAHVMETDRR